MHNHSVMIVDDHPIIRHGLKRLIELERELIVTAETDNGEDAINIACQIKPDIILIDLKIHGLSGIDTIKSLRRKGLDSYVLVLSDSDNRGDIYDAIDAGANGYLLKDIELTPLISKIKKAANGDAVYSEKVYQYLSTRHLYIDPLSKLTKRELDVLKEISEGMTNKEIADFLFISEETVKVHTRNLLKKLKSRSRLEATIIYLRHRKPELV
ncbi:response regulator in two-component regulatory system with NarQ (or NarX), regulates anaerobic respiratory gene expression [Xenorhabdus bovienii str. Jollieti]|uniref:Response regulator in two-component regulatory system with NarQ (Or NarX), regulates anaerobic respiratory gene expression n=1 Tax=Xenorhabdus bovienii (strain SS-2004) TaxID=406818 RepID=D3V7A4_XENBS|nr:response regulator [Xenorhabdus bovienii]CBJ81716.1 response regulator in two-component regulatory system with NarQ (or NarX), regulates anaerobic respiratory gene expression [Xenorhabdus bovienii SS-2004]CDH27606.1 response regulator in two-component regulatory system with NarQ (or NarX), regulates anaerobic respiratory gene expression [Xenorhabdus bovienii str. Jollieti]